jgi:purine-binding chemotaxis protein CheW
MVTTPNLEHEQQQGPQAAAEKKAEKIDFKMVTFVLAGKEYGIDIMNVKEIAYAGAFTYVPNAAPFVRGVYNLRGEIISIIDLRMMFHLPAERKAENAVESLLILCIGERIFGVIVDSIDKVVGISSGSIQPPHPIFGDINVKYIKGIVENDKRLYIILDVEKIFAQKDEKQEQEERYQSARAAAEERVVNEVSFDSNDMDEKFVKETLFQFRNFAVTPVNDKWFKRRFEEWRQGKNGSDIQLHEIADADAFMQPFWSRSTGALWPKDYFDKVIAGLTDFDTKNINVWNPGCGKGYETYSFACALIRRYPGSRIKIWANDSDLLNVSMAPNMVFPEGDVPDYLREWTVTGKNGLSFNQQVKDSIFFEFHDVLNANPLPAIDIVLCRDMVSLLAPVDQKRIMTDFAEKLRKNGRVLVGDNEELPAGEGWRRADDSAFFQRDERG